MNDGGAKLSGVSFEKGYASRTPGSARLYADALAGLPSGITHDIRHFAPHPLYVERAQGARKWDVDGNEYVDYLGGHGALLLGHGHSAVTEAVTAQAAVGTHFGASHELEVRWAALVRDMVPSAERVRFTASGTEATLLALRLARAHTGAAKVIRFEGHFHGWHDNLITGYAPPFDEAPPGVQAEVAAATLVAPPGDEDAVRRLVDEHGDIAAIIIEPTGAHFGKTVLRPDFLHFLREITNSHDIILIFDEVVTGFRVAPGGAQALYGVTPDITALGKVLAGGLPGGAVAGREDLMDLLDFDIAEARGVRKIGHPGTFNANPLSAAAGVAALSEVAGTDACGQANAFAAELRDALNRALAQEGVPWAVYGSFSDFHLYTNLDNRTLSPLEFDPFSVDHRELSRGDPALQRAIRLGMLINGVDINARFSGWTSAAHGAPELEDTLRAFHSMLRGLKQDGLVAEGGAK